MVNFLLSSFFDDLMPIAKWLTISLVICFALVCLILFLAKVKNAKAIIRSAFIGLIFYALVFGIILLISNIARKTRFA